MSLFSAVTVVTLSYESRPVTTRRINELFSFNQVRDIRNCMCVSEGGGGRIFLLILEYSGRGWEPAGAHVLEGCFLFLVCVQNLRLQRSRLALVSTVTSL